MNIDQQNLDGILEELSGFQKKIINSAKQTFIAGDSNLYSLDFFASAVYNRAISLTNGYVLLSKGNNYLAAVSLIRLQLDNVLRFFASSLVKDSSDFVNHFIEGKKISDYKDINGNKLFDSYLAKLLEAYIPGTQKLYDETCAYIHLSNKHFFPTVAKVDFTNRKVGIQIGSYDVFSIDEKINFSSTMLEVSKLVILVIEKWQQEKSKKK